MFAKLLTPLAIKVMLAVIVATFAWIGFREVQLSLLRADLTTAQTKLEQTERERDSYRDSVAEANRQHGITKTSLRDTLKQLRNVQKEILRQKSANDTAIAKVLAEKRDAEVTLKQISDDFADALRDPACTICGNQPVCPALLGGARP